MYPGAFLMAVAAVVGAWLLPGPRSVAGIVFDIHTLLFSAAALIVGFEAVVFGVFTMIFGITEDLLPEDRRLDHLFKYVTLEVGLCVGGALLTLGLLLGVWNLGVWRAHGFGPLHVQETLRIAIPSVTLVVLGCQIVLSSFVLSFLGLRRL